MANPNKQLFNRIVYTYNQMKRVYDGASRSLSADWKSVISQLTELYNYASQLYKQMNPQTDKGLANYYHNAGVYMDRCRQILTQAQGQMRSQDVQPTKDSRTDLLNDGGFGRQLGQLGDMFPSPYSGNDPTQAANYQNYLQMLLTQMQYEWQKQSDDLAYQRSNPATLYQTLIGLGMSPLAALGAASGSPITTAGSSVGASISPDNMNAALGEQQIGVQQQSVDTQRYGISGQLSMAQQELHRKYREMEEQYFDIDLKRKGYEEIQKTFNYVYGMQQFHVDVPLHATISQTEFKIWLRGTGERFQQIVAAVGTGAYTISDGMILDEQGGSVCSLQELQGYNYAYLAYEEIKRHVGSIAYGLEFENLFMANYGPRAYHQQEDASRLERAKIATAQIQNWVDNMDAIMQGEELQADAFAAVLATVNSTEMDSDGQLVPTEAAKQINEVLAQKGYEIRGGVVGKPVYDSEGNETEFQQLSFEEMYKANLLRLPISYAQYKSLRNSLNQMQFATQVNYQLLSSRVANELRAAVQEAKTNTHRYKAINNAFESDGLISDFMTLDAVYNQSGIMQLTGRALEHAVNNMSDKVTSAIGIGTALNDNFNRGMEFLKFINPFGGKGKRK